MAISLKSISKGVVRRAPRIILLGVEKIGKSTFAGSAPNPIFVQVKGEEGIDGIDAAKFPVAKTFAELLECLGVLATEKHDYQTVCIDSTTTLEPLIWQATCADNGGAASIEKVGGGYGKGYVEALKYWRELTDAMDYLRTERGMASILIGHVKVKTFNDPLADPYDQYQWTIQDRASSMLYPWADCTLFANFKAFSRTVAETGMGDSKKAIKHATGTPERYLYTQKRPAHPGGCRYSLPYEMALNWPTFAGAMEAAINPPAAK